MLSPVIPYFVSGLVLIVCSKSQASFKLFCFIDIVKVIEMLKKANAVSRSSILV